MEDGSEEIALIPGKFMGKRLRFNLDDLVHVKRTEGKFYDLFQKIEQSNERDKALRAMKGDDIENDYFIEQIQSENEDEEDENSVDSNGNAKPEEDILLDKAENRSKFKAKDKSHDLKVRQERGAKNDMDTDYVPSSIIKKEDKKSTESTESTESAEDTDSTKSTESSESSEED